MMNEFTSQVRQNWERPALYRLDAADARNTNSHVGVNDGSNNKS
jgi:hypothetical protein